MLRVNDAAERVYTLSAAAAAWHVDPAIAEAWIAEGRVRAITREGVLWVPIGEVARHQTVLRAEPSAAWPVGAYLTG
jgi:hypothetical protein